MFSSIAEKLWGSQIGDPDFESPGKSTVADETEQCGQIEFTGEIKCSLWHVEGNDAQEALEESQVQVTDDKLCFVGMGGNKGKKHEFKYTDMVHFHEEQQDIYQWIIRRTPEHLEEFGAAFQNVLCGQEFGKLVRPKLRDTANIVIEQKVKFEEYDYSSKAWVTKHNDALISIMQRPSDFEAFLVVTKLTDSTVLSEIGISHEEYIFPQPELQQLTWWGPAANDNTDRRQMVCVKFCEGDAKMKEVLAAFDKVLQEHAGSGDSDVAMYDLESFDLKACGDEVEFVDAEEIRAEDIKFKDTTRQIVSKSPKSRVHKMMFVGSQRTFVVRGSVGLQSKEADNVEMQVLKFDSGKEEVVATLDGTKLKYKSDTLCPTQALLHDGESKLLLMDEGNQNDIFLMDVQKEQVVQSWNGGEGMKVQNIMETAQGSGSTSDPTFLCNGAKTLFKMDARVGQKEAKSVARTTSLTYATNVNFTAGATDSKGHILMGSKGGDMRLYDGAENKDGQFKRAKTRLQGLGDPLLHVAVTSDGSWILGTCAKYLVLFPVKLASSGKTGFVSALGKAKPPPIILKPSMDDMIKYNLADVHFSKAEFNQDETAIVTSTGNLAIVWDFSKAVKTDGMNGARAYTIRAVDDYIKDVDFVRSGGHDSLVMATPCGVTTKSIIQ